MQPRCQGPLQDPGNEVETNVHCRVTDARKVLLNLSCLLTLSNINFTLIVNDTFYIFSRCIYIPTVHS